MGLGSGDAERLALGAEEIAPWGDVGDVIFSKGVDGAYADLGHIYRAERIKPNRNPWLPQFVKGLGAAHWPPPSSC